MTAYDGDWFAPGGDPGPAPRRGLRPVLLVAAVLGTAALVGGAAFGARWFFASTGPQPDQALPAGTLAYLALDLDPTGEQKVEAYRFLRRFPVIEEELDLQVDTDPAALLSDLLDNECGERVDLAPWLGDRAAMAVVPVGEDVVPAMVLAVTDPEAARAAAPGLEGCLGRAGAVVTDEFMVVSETRLQAEKVVASAAEASLAEDETYAARLEEVGGTGLVTGYVATSLLDRIDEVSRAFGSGPVGAETERALTDELAGFAGAAAAVRFSDGALQVDAVGPVPTEVALSGGEGTLASRLPASTGIALGYELRQGWLTELLARFETAIDLGAFSPGGFDRMLADAEEETGLDLPDDLETLIGHRAAVALDGAFDPATMERSYDDGPDDGSDDEPGDGPGQASVPVGILSEEDPAEVERIAATVERRATEGPHLVTATGEGVVAVGFDPAWVDELAQSAGPGGLGEREAFVEVVPEPERATFVLFVDFEAAWVDGLRDSMGLRDDLVRTVDPLRALGMSSWVAGDTLRGQVRLTLD